MRTYLAVALAVGGILSYAKVGFAQDPVLSRLYGSAVHEFYGGNYAKAHELLSRAIDMGLQDPRAYYFRGLAYLKLGRPDEAEDDFRTGAEIEARDAGIFYDVGRSLERIQGRARMILERHRLSARTTAYRRALEIHRERYGEQQARQRGFILEQATPPPPTKVGPPALPLPQVEQSPALPVPPFGIPPTGMRTAPPAEMGQEVVSQPGREVAPKEVQPGEKVEAEKIPEAWPPQMPGALPVPPSLPLPPGQMPEEESQSMGEEVEATEDTGENALEEETETELIESEMMEEESPASDELLPLPFFNLGS